MMLNLANLAVFPSSVYAPHSKLWGCPFLLLPTMLVAQAATTFGPQQVITTAVNDARSVYATDLDGDGDLDVLSASYWDSKIAWYENLGGGSLGPQRVITTAALGANSVYATDLDGDGDADVLSASAADNKIAFYVNDGAGNFSQQFVITTAANGAQSVYAIDLDGDGDVDVLSASSADDKIAYYENLGFGFFGPQQVITTAADGANCVYASDLDGDGDADVLSASSNDSKIALYENLGGGNFGPQQVIPLGPIWTQGARGVRTADLDGDGDADVVSASSFVFCAFSQCVTVTDYTVWFENLGGGSFGGVPQVIHTQVLGSGYAYASVDTADLDGDGDIDVLSATPSDHKIAWYENLGGGSFGPRQVITSVATGARSVCAADLDGDGYVDVLSAPPVAWYRNTTPPLVTSTVTSYGAGCGNPAMLFTPTSTAVLGTALTGWIVNTPTPYCVVAAGTSNTLSPGFGALPLDLGVAGMPGCMLYQSAEVFGLGTQQTGVAFQVTFSLPLPQDVGLLGQHFFFQAFSYAPGANPLQVISSNGVDWLIGNQ